MAVMASMTPMVRYKVSKKANVIPQLRTPIRTKQHELKPPYETEEDMAVPAIEPKYTSAKAARKAANKEKKDLSLFRDKRGMDMNIIRELEKLPEYQALSRGDKKTFRDMVARGAAGAESAIRYIKQSFLRDYFTSPTGAEFVGLRESELAGRHGYTPAEIKEFIKGGDKRLTEDYQAAEDLQKYRSQHGIKKAKGGKGGKDTVKDTIKKWTKKREAQFEKV